jgi:hypothetical protein
MRLGIFTVFLVALLAGVMPGQAGELFRRGPVSCASTLPGVTAMTIDRCRWGMSNGAAKLWGSCDGSVMVNGAKVGFTVTGSMNQTTRLLPDNNTHVTFKYAGLACALTAARIKSVGTCSYSNGGRSEQCHICGDVMGKRCYIARMAVIPKKTFTAEK